MAERVSADFTFHDVKVKIVGNLDIICVRKSAFLPYQCQHSHEEHSSYQLQTK